MANKQTHSENSVSHAAIARWIMLTVLATVLVGLWTPLGLVVGLIALYLFGIGVVLWRLKDEVPSGGVLCAACQYYEPETETLGRCALARRMAKPQSTPCADFILRAA